MRTDALEAEAALEKTHWWFCVRRSLFKRILFECMPNFGHAEVLDIGVGSGGNLRTFQEMGIMPVGLDPNPAAIEICHRKGLGQVKLGSITDIPYGNACFDFVSATDVIEHVEEDRKALMEVLRILKPGGVALFTVPAFKSLWGYQDEVSMHKRRYRHKELVVKIKAAGFSIEQSFYFNFLLFFPILLARKYFRRFPANIKSENEINTQFLNSVLKIIFGLDVRIAPLLRPPFGASILVLAHRPEQS